MITKGKKGNTGTLSIVTIGGGFAGLWAALGAAAKLDDLGLGPQAARVTLVNRDAYHAIRVRNYERDLDGVRVPLAPLLDRAGIELVEGEVVDLDPERREVRIAGRDGDRGLAYDGLVLAAGSQLHRPEIPGLAEHAYCIDTYTEARRLDDHIRGLSALPDTPGRATALIVGAGLTGIEAACEMPERLREALGGAAGRVLLADRAPRVGSALGESARPVVEGALSDLGIETRGGVTVTAVDGQGVTLGTGERLEAGTVVWTAGMRASPLAARLPVARDPLGRIAVDATMKVEGVEGVFAAGDVARALIDGQHAAVMSCQFGRPMGRFAGHNVVCDLLGEAPRPLSIEDYVTCVDLGPWGAVFTRGWDRQLEAQGPEAKRIKETINRVRIYPPGDADRRALLDAAAATVQALPRR